MALQALGKYAERSYGAAFNVTIKIQNGADSHNFNINPQNSLVLQSYEVNFNFLKIFLEILKGLFFVKFFPPHL